MDDKNDNQQSKYICPRCRSKNIVWWEENVIEHLYKIKKDGEKFKKPFEKLYSNADALEGIKCLDCHNYMNMIMVDDEEYDEWLQSTTD